MFLFFIFRNMFQTQLPKSTVLFPVILTEVNRHALVRDVFLILVIDYADLIFLKLNTVIWMSIHNLTFLCTRIKGGKGGEEFFPSLFSSDQLSLSFPHQVMLRTSSSSWRENTNSSLLWAETKCFPLFPKVTQAASRKALEKPLQATPWNVPLLSLSFFSWVIVVN